MMCFFAAFLVSYMPLDNPRSARAKLSRDRSESRLLLCRCRTHYRSSVADASRSALSRSSARKIRIASLTKEVLATNQRTSGSGESCFAGCLQNRAPTPSRVGRNATCARCASRRCRTMEIKILRRVRAESSRHPPRHRRDACSMAWRCRFSRRSTELGRPRHRREMT